MHEDLDPQQHARRILQEYFGLCRTALGTFGSSRGPLEYCGWSVEKHSVIVQLLAEGCHNLPELVAGKWIGWQSVTRDELLSGLVQECQWLYDRAEKLEYPAVWDRDPMMQGSWREFWNAIAVPLNKPPRYGIPFEWFETDGEAHQRIFLEARDRDLLRTPLKSGLAMSLLGLRGEYLIEQPPKPTTTGAFNAATAN